MNVLLIAYNRPVLTNKVFAEIKKAKPSHLFVSLDSPKYAKDISKCLSVFEIIKVDWDCKVKYLIHQTNQGGKWGGYKAITWFFQNVSEGIILEDDDVPDPSFFPFCETLLDVHRNDLNIGTISGDNFQFGKRAQDSYYYSKFFNGWGWATWKRVWESFDINLLNWEKERCEGFNYDFIDDPREIYFWRQALDRMFDGSDDAWDYQFTYHLWKKNMLNIIPSVNLITNIGSGEDSTHSMVNHPLVNLKTEPMIFPLKRPSEIKRNKEFDKNLLRYYL
jgi:hypothetical protein